MHFRLKLFSLHLLSSAAVLTLILGSLYFGWYGWPGWYLTDVTQVVVVMVCVDVVLGPTLTLIIANQKKSRRELTRDIGIIVAVQLCALTYGSVSLWSGRPLYYAFSENVLQLVQAYDIDAQEANSGANRIPPSRRIGIACRAGYGRRCLKIQTNGRKFLKAPSLGAMTSLRCRGTSSAGKRDCLRFETNSRRLTLLGIFLRTREKSSRMK